MIYAGFLSFNNTADITGKITSVLKSMTHEEPVVLNKNSLVLCYGKLSSLQDLDEVWINDSSFLIGRVFDKEQHCAFRKEEFKNLSSFDKEKVLDKIWGKYVYIHTNKETSEVEIVLDSTGQLPFFYYSFPNENVLFASDIHIIYRILSQKPEYNWHYLCSYLIYGNSSSIETPFKHVYELPPACCLTITNKEKRTVPFWNPLCSYKVPEIKEKSAVDVLKQTIKPWIDPYQNICVHLSGGLDSSSLVYCLKDLVRQDQTLTAINYFHSQIKSSNEFHHAQKVCDETGIELIGIDTSNCLPFDSPQGKQHIYSNKPFPGMVSLRWLETIEAQSPLSGSTTTISGHGSDHIFMRPPSKKSVLDYVLENGLKGSKTELESIAQFYRDPLVSILKENIQSLITYSFGKAKEKRNIQIQMNDIPKWVKQEAIKKTSNIFSHPIYRYLSKRILPGKYDQIDAVYEGLSSIHVEMMNQADPTYYPFLYQPVVEFALSFPTYDLFDKGYDRYPLRQSVSDRFRTETVWRRDKSQTTGVFQLGIKKNLKEILDLCLEGHFVSQGLIDKPGLHSTINLIANGSIKDMWPLIQLFSTEIFLRSWDEITYA